ncbi:hypothetical protein A9Q86_10405 [Flavobacteriales bacterium 33_180_T64]|mgnify:CR=1 FL=1|nr:hypothetical protein A9Q86_10405 [Flavobacteriales bacterium 33_180_T64]
MKTNAPIFLLVCFKLILFNSCKDNNQEKLKTSDVVSNQQEIKTKSVQEHCHVDYGELSKFVYDTKKDVNLFENVQYDDSENYFFTNADKFVDEALALITCKNISKNQKRLTFQLMNGLGYEKYFNFIDDCYGLYKSGQISASNFEYILFNNWRKRHYVAKYHKNEKIVVLLNKILNDKVLLEKSPLLKKRVEDALSGEYWKERKAFYTSDAIMDEKALKGW